VVLHGHTVLGVAESDVIPNPTVVQGGGGTRIIAPATRIIWTFKLALPPPQKPQPILKTAYTWHVAGEEVSVVVNGAVSWLDRTLATP
jgi:hypothetical protein